MIPSERSVTLTRREWLVMYAALDSLLDDTSAWEVIDVFDEKSALAKDATRAELQELRDSLTRILAMKR